MSATFRSTPKNITMIQCYAPTADKPEEELEEFYHKLAETLSQIPKSNILIITGDFNARVGEGATKNDSFRKFGYGERNNAGQML